MGLLIYRKLLKYLWNYFDSFYFRFHFHLVMMTTLEEWLVGDCEDCEPILPLNYDANQQWSHHKPIYDGNCLYVYRAVSKTISGDETSHVLLRFTTVLRTRRQSFYDCYHRKHLDSTCDNRFMCGSFEQILNDAVTIKLFSGMSHIYALSAALRKGVRGQPVRAQLHEEFVSEP